MMKRIAKRLHRNTCNHTAFTRHLASTFELWKLICLESSLCFLVRFLRANAPFPKTWHANISPKQVSLCFLILFDSCQLSVEDTQERFLHISFPSLELLALRPLYLIPQCLISERLCRDFIFPCACIVFAWYGCLSRRPGYTRPQCG